MKVTIDNAPADVCKVFALINSTIHSYTNCKQRSRNEGHFTSVLQSDTAKNRKRASRLHYVLMLKNLRVKYPSKFLNITDIYTKDYLYNRKYVQTSLKLIHIDDNKIDAVLNWFEDQDE